MLIGKNILIISPEAWGINHVSKHHYAINLALRGNVVYFLNPPTKTFREEKIGENFYAVNYKPFIRGIQKLPFLLSSLLIQYEIRRLERRLTVNFDIIWNFDPSRFFNLSKISNKLKIAHIVDLNQEFEREILVQTSDISFCTTSFIQEELSKFSDSVFKIHHGYSTLSAQFDQVRELPTVSGLKAVYTGNLSMAYIDWESILATCLDNNHVSFIFVGPDGESNLGKTSRDCFSKQKIKGLTNTYFIGSIEAGKVANILDQADVLFVCYKAYLYKEQLAAPHKMMEYLASGKMIVTTYTHEYRELKELIKMVEIGEDFNLAFQSVIANLNYWNDKQLSGKRKAFALENTYEKQIGKIEKLIEQNVN